MGSGAWKATVLGIAELDTTEWLTLSLQRRDKGLIFCLKEDGKLRSQLRYKVFIFLAALHDLWDLSSLNKSWTLALHNESVES